jgi:hypothetical protein
VPVTLADFVEILYSLEKNRYQIVLSNIFENDFFKDSATFNVDTGKFLLSHALSLITNSESCY